MGRKYRVRITEESSSNPEYKIFNFSFDQNLLGLVIFGAFDLRKFNKAGYLSRLITNFKEKNDAYYLLFSSFGGVRGASEQNIDKVLSQAYAYLSLEPIPPESWSEKMMLSSANPIYFLILKEDKQYSPEIFTYIDSIDTWCSFIFAGREKKDEIFGKIKKYHKEKTISEKNLLTLGAEIITLRVAGYGAEENFRILTKRFDYQQIKELFLNSVDADKFEVVSDEKKGKL